MLGKLMKHEWKNVYKFGSILILTIMIVTALGYVFLQSPFLKNAINSEVEMTDVQAIVLVLAAIGSFILYVMLLAGAGYAILIYMGVHFYKTMYTDRGYLTHTLPVKSGQILASKIMISGAWVFLVYAAVYISIFVLVFGFMQGMLGAVELEMSFAEVWDELVKVYKEIGWDMNHYIIILVLIAIASPFTAVIQIFGALTIGQLSKKYKLLMGILTYVGLTIVNYIITFILEMAISMTQMITADGELSMEFMTTTYDVSFIYNIVLAVALGVVSHFIIKKKLNME